MSTTRDASGYKGIVQWEGDLCWKEHRCQAQFDDTADAMQAAEHDAARNGWMMIKVIQRPGASRYQRPRLLALCPKCRKNTIDRTTRNCLLNWWNWLVTRPTHSSRKKQRAAKWWRGGAAH